MSINLLTQNAASPEAIPEAISVNSSAAAHLHETPAAKLESLYNELVENHPIGKYGRSKIHLHTGIPYFSLCNGAYLVSILDRSIQKPGRCWHLYILDYTCRHYIRTGPYLKESLLKRLTSECRRKLEN